MPDPYYAMAPRIRNLFLDGPAGRLECLLEEPGHGPAREACLVCHPHPLYGGTMHNKVVHRLARGLRRSGAVVLRFNFRGVGLSEGEYDHGAGETEDARSALEWLRSRYPELPNSLAGFSFGARVVFRLGCALQDAERLIAAGFPTRAGDVPELHTCRSEKIFFQSTADQYGPKQELEALFATLPEPKKLIWIPAADHFFTGALNHLEEAVYGLASSPRN